MCMIKSLLVTLCLSISYCNALNCRSEGGPKEDKLKKVYNMCLKQQNNNTTTNMYGYGADNDWRGTRGYNQKSQWNQNNNSGMKDDSKRDYRKRGKDRYGHENRMQNRDSADGGNRMQEQDKGENNKANRMGYVEKSEGIYRMDVRDMGQYGNNENGQDTRNGLSGRNDFLRDEHFGERSRYDNYNNQYSTQPSRRYKRERRVETNSGKRSQYNPNPQKFSGYEEKYKEEEQNSNENNSTEETDKKSCALHCFLENLQMTDDNGMPDRHLVTHTITKDVKDEDLKDFLLESIEECFQILGNENTDDKCDFSKNLLMCLSEKGRANCDDWKHDFQF